MLYFSQMKQPNIVVVGHVCIDHNVSEHASYTNWGSGALYMASHAQRVLGVTPMVVTSYGEDFAQYGHAFTLHPAAPQVAKTLVYKNVTKNGSRVQHCEQSAASGPPELDATTRRLLASADIVILATLLPNYSVKYVRELLGLTPLHCLKVCCPQGYFRHVNRDGSISPREFAEASELLPLFDLTFLSEEDYPSAHQLAQRWKAQPHMSEIVITEGPRGASIVTTGGLEHIPTRAIAEEDVVDSVGCGDVFAMATTYGYYMTHDLKAAILRGHLAASYKLLSVETVLDVQLGAAT